MRPRLFSLMLSAFALVIILGVCGMLSFFALAVGSATHNQERTVMQASSVWQDNQPQLERALAEALAGYYVQRNSWEGVGQQADVLVLVDDAGNWFAYVLADQSGVVLATNERDTSVGEFFVPPPAASPVAVEVSGRQVATLYTTFNRRAPWSGWPPMTAVPVVAGDRPRFVPFGVSGFAQGIVSAGLALIAILLILAAFFSRRISRPLSQLTSAARTMAAGDMSVRVKGHAVREIDDLSQAFNRMADALVQADQQRRQLNADIAHELRTPLSIIKGRLEGVEDGVYEASPEQIAGLLDEVALLERLIEDLRLLALADAGQLPLYPEPVDATQLLHDVARSFKHQAGERAVTLQIDAEEGLPEINADAQRIAQVLGNLVGNALRYTPTGGTVTLHVTQEAHQPMADAILFAVSDTGAGIDPNDLPHIFDRFWRADRSRTRSSGGAGLGLAIARRIVEAHGGRIWAESTPGEGTTISFSIPLEGEGWYTIKQADSTTVRV